MQIVPEDTRYVPLTQQPSCCVPTCIQMVMLRHKIPLLPAEEIGYYLGLTVHPERKHLFYNVRTSEVPLASGGYGTQVSVPEYEPNQAFKKLGIPLKFTVKPISEFTTPEDLVHYLSIMEQEDKDIVLCFNHAVLINDKTKGGHVCVFDRMVGNQIRIIDPSPQHPKWRGVAPVDMFEAMKQHKVQATAGCWELSPVSDRRAAFSPLQPYVFV